MCQFVLQKYFKCKMGKKMLLSYMTVTNVFLVHLFLVIIVCFYIVGSEFYFPQQSDEVFLVWAIFLVVDFPTSIIVLLTSGPTVVSIPKWISIYYHGKFFSELVWPAVIFQIVGTINWITLIYLYKLFFHKTV